MAGQVIGIASRILTKSGGFEGLGFVVESFLVQQVAENSPAARLGLRPEGIESQIGLNEMLLGGDVILEVVGIQVSEGCYEKIQNRLSHTKPRDIITVKVLRAGGILQLSATRDP